MPKGRSSRGCNSLPRRSSYPGWPTTNRSAPCWSACSCPGSTDEEHASSLAELGRLAKTLGLDVIGRVTPERTALAAGAVVGEGKLKELAGSPADGRGAVRSAGAPRARRRRGARSRARDAEDEAEDEPAPTPADRANVVLVDHDLTPSQARNLERATGAEVLDRTAVILAIFQRHARSREARLQVEIARLAYLAPRLRESGGGKDRQRGGIGGKGAGESQLELDRRKVRDRIAELRARAARRSRRTPRTRRRRRAAAAHGGAGRLHQRRQVVADARADRQRGLVADKLFATLDTTVRALQPETRPRILVSDTVGFIKKLPHDLVASFRSTLDEAREAELLLHVVDAADPAFPAQIAVTREVLARDRRRRRAAPAGAQQGRQARRRAARRAARRRWPDAVLLSAKSSRRRRAAARAHRRVLRARHGGTGDPRSLREAERRERDPRQLPRARRGLRSGRHPSSCPRPPGGSRPPARGAVKRRPPLWHHPAVRPFRQKKYCNMARPSTHVSP